MNTTGLKIAALAGDGIGPEIMREAIKVLRAIERKQKLSLEITEAPVGWAAIDQEGKALPENTLALCKKSEAILFGAVGLHYRDAEIPKEKRPERAALLQLRKQFGLFANLRPIKLLPALAAACPLHPERQEKGIDLLFVRESTGGVYYAYPRKTEEVLEVKDDGTTTQRIRRAVDTMALTTTEIERIAHVGFRAAWLRRKRLTSVDKANVLETGILWRDVVTEVSTQYPDVVLEHVLIDTAAMQLILRPSQFDVILCGNMFGDILSDVAAALVGSVGMLPSASLSTRRHGRTFGLYQPAGGTAPDIAGKNVANPIAQILAAALMLRHSFGLDPAAKAVENAVDRVISEGYRTRDISSQRDSKTHLVSTSQMGDAIAAAIV
ncbi:MAG TPA: 3-isopropylmalate dehydrogenase [Candidatus Paceibacterota bacterium]|nr:3-isopropylmalate dehydrogenase [Verrucomicrobiota bacterium]HRY51726.1 3-isopropylmalate dehydrogenase [Candidatus Paceibacterota bacterium]HSA03314.1 3-isopropylmalate dehydrogenase [Candidatus Paceibacterota bacterium]